MLTIVSQSLLLGETSGDVDWSGQVALMMGMIAIGLLLWQLYHVQQQFAIDLADQAKETEAAEEHAAQVWREREGLARENQAKSEMLSTLSREIRANLNGIMGSADLMLDHSLSNAQREHLATMRSSAESLHQSLNDVLDYAGIETGEIKIGSAPFDLRQPLIEVIEHISPLATLKGLELVLIVTTDVPLNVSGDAARLRQVLLNLVSNAVRYTKSGRVVLRAEVSTGSTAVSKSGATWLHFGVTDTGAGIPKEVLATIFDRIAPNEAVSTRAFGGSGLTLPICKRFVELMGGHIGARSLPDGGSEFWVILPLVADRTQPVPPPAGPEFPHVVVLDDLSPSRVSVTAMLTRLGLDHDATETVAKARSLLRDAVAAGAKELVLLLDESVVKDSAAELAPMFTQDNALRSTRIVLMTQNPDIALVAEQEFPVTAVVRKPLVRPEVLLDALQQKRSARGPRPAGSRTPFELGEAKAPAPKGPQVLVVDDDEISRSVSGQLLARLGCVVERATSGAEAIERVRTTAFDLVFMDSQLPGMDGFETTQIIRTTHGEKAPPIVALTANTSIADREKCSAVGMCAFIDKPVRKAELARILKRWAKQGSSTAS